MSSYGTEGIILKATDLGEADKIFTVYTSNKGKIKAVAKGVKRPESHKSGSLDVLSCTKLFLAEGRNLDVILEVELL